MSTATDLTINDVIRLDGSVNREALDAHIPSDVEGDQRKSEVDRLEESVRSFASFALTPGRDPIQLAGFLGASAVSAPPESDKDDRDNEKGDE